MFARESNALWRWGLHVLWWVSMCKATGREERMKNCAMTLAGRSKKPTTTFGAWTNLKAYLQKNFCNNSGKQYFESFSKVQSPAFRYLQLSETVLKLGSWKPFLSPLHMMPLVFRSWTTKIHVWHFEGSQESSLLRRILYPTAQVAKSRLCEQVNRCKPSIHSVSINSIDRLAQYTFGGSFGLPTSHYK